MPIQSGKIKGVADVVFVLDVSGSMSPIIQEVKNHISTFVGSIRSNSQSPIDLRLGLVTHESTDGDRRGVKAYPFTDEAGEFQERLTSCENGSTGNEFGLPALDRALDFDWRPSSRRFVVAFTDEPVAGGSEVEFQVAKLPELKQKFAALRVAGYVIGPSCAHYDDLCSGPRMVRIKVEQQDLARYDFSRFLGELGRTVSIAPQQEAPAPGRQNLYSL